MSFSGHGYARWQVKVPMERRLSLSLRVKTLQHRARLMHAVGRVDYSILEVTIPCYNTPLFVLALVTKLDRIYHWLLLGKVQLWFLSPPPD